MKKQNSIVIKPEVGMGATIQHWSDRSPATVIKVSPSGKKILLQEDWVTRLDSNGMSEVQEYAYHPDDKGTIYTATLRDDGSYRLKGSKQLVSLGIRRKYHDYSF